MNLKGKKVLLMGLGVLGGGVATARFLVEQGADLTITDLKTAEFLKPSLEKLKDFPSIEYVLGEHQSQDFLDNEIIVINPDISIKNKFVELAKQNNKQIENELTLFYKLCPSKNIISITGTRGKTTTANWVAHFLKQKFPNTVLAGNSPENTFLGMLLKITGETQVVLEVPSYHLEIERDFKPHIAVITNIYQDHLNRHSNMEEYAKIKGNIFKNQTEEDFLILNKENEWTKFLLELKPKSQTLFFSPENDTPNLAASRLAARTCGLSEEEIKRAIPSLPAIKWRQEKVFESPSQNASANQGKLEIYNDTAATSPEATLTALARFPEAIFIVGGTDRELDYKNWAETLNKNIKPENLILLSGSATEKMKTQLNWANYNEFDTLEECLSFALERAKAKTDKAKIIFSPGAKSFEKFKNEFDRGEKFNEIVKKLVKLVK